MSRDQEQLGFLVMSFLRFQVFYRKGGPLKLCEIFDTKTAFPADATLRWLFTEEGTIG
jgi:hypothetical protein